MLTLRSPGEMSGDDPWSSGSRSELRHRVPSLSRMGDGLLLTILSGLLLEIENRKRAYEHHELDAHGHEKVYLGGEVPKQDAE